MQLSLKIALITVMLIYILCTLKAVKRKNMRIGYLIFWTIIGVALFVALCIPGLVENISKTIGFEMPINMLFSAAIFVILYLIFNLTTIISREQRKNVLLIQEISMLKARVEKLEEKEKENG